MTAEHRRCVVLRGGPAATAESAVRLLSRLDPEHVLWVTQSKTSSRFEARAPRQVQTLLGRAFDAVVLDFHDGLDADLIGQSHGFVWGGGALVLRLPTRGDVSPEAQRRFAAHPYAPKDVGRRFYALLDEALDRAQIGPAGAIEPCAHVRQGTEEQSALVSSLVSLLANPAPGFAVVVADRGRGKSSALGLALAEMRPRESGAVARRVAVSAAHRDAVHEVFRFAGVAPAPDFVSPLDLAFGATEYDVIVIDEAAQLPVPLLQRIVSQHTDATIAFATTARGYEGTGRGFLLRFVAWLRAHPRPLTELTLEAPIRWGRDDPLEGFIFDALHLDAKPAEVEREVDLADVEHVALDRDRLVGDPDLLRGFFGLLVHAHYRTTPSDLHRMLDAPNLRLHALLHRGRVVAATWVAIEGELPPALSTAIHWGHTRVRGHALAETLLSHSGRPEAGPLRMIRSVRIAVHPALRRRGLGTLLIDHIHRSYAPDLFGTLFGATADLLAFRRSVGYEVIRVGASRGTRTGEPAAVMMRPVSPRAHALFHTVRADLARDLPLQLSLMSAGNELVLDPALEAALHHALPTPPALTAEEIRYAVATFAYGPRTLEAAAVALTAFIEAHRAALAHLAPQDRGLIEDRVLHHLSWIAVMQRACTPSVPATMRAARRAVRALAERVDPEIADIPPPKTQHA